MEKKKVNNIQIVIDKILLNIHIVGIIKTNLNIAAIGTKMIMRNLNYIKKYWRWILSLVYWYSLSLKDIKQRVNVGEQKQRQKVFQLIKKPRWVIQNTPNIKQLEPSNFGKRGATTNIFD